jgi:hypothetical protein
VCLMHACTEPREDGRACFFPPSLTLGVGYMRAPGTGTRVGCRVHEYTVVVCTRQQSSVYAYREAVHPEKPQLRPASHSYSIAAATR